MLLFFGVSVDVVVDVAVNADVVVIAADADVLDDGVCCSCWC